jgi:two-component sensor histidine kinase
MPSARLSHRSSNRRDAASAPKIETGLEINTLRFQCANSGREVDSGISTQCRSHLISIRVHCPICQDLHEWQVADERLATDFSADSHQGPQARTAELREQLLDELNHRLKNSLQMLYGLLQISWSKTHNAEAREALSDTGRRIGAMGAAQQIFYSVHNSTDVNGKSLLEAVCVNAEAFFGEAVSITYESTAGSLPKETAIPLALALNELLTNAAKHGADDRGRITIAVGLSQRPGEIELYVQDRGPGFDFEDSQGRLSGLGLVRMLAARLKGSFTVERRPGARCTLRFPDQ